MSGRLYRLVCYQPSCDEYPIASNPGLIPPDTAVPDPVVSPDTVIIESDTDIVSEVATAPTNDDS